MRSGEAFAPVVAVLLTTTAASPAGAQSSLAGDTIRISRAAGPITIDGDLSDEGWRNAARVEKWYEINPGDNTEPSVKNVGYLTYDDRFLYAGFELADASGALITRSVEPGLGMDTRWNGFMQFRFLDDRTRAGDAVIGRRQFGYIVQFSPSRVVKSVGVNGNVGQEIDFANARPGRGATVNLSATLQPGEQLELALVENTRLLRVDDASAVSRHLFTQRVSRVKATYTFTARMFVRLIGQYVSTDRDPSLYRSSVDATAGTFGGSALFAYKLNWQSVMFVGYGDDRQLSDQNRLERLDRQLFVKLSYAFQR